MGPTVLSDALAGLALVHDPNLLVGMETSDDAAVYRLSDTSALISTADFITPPVDDPYWFGQIAAANALSDVYAMGGKPLLALNLVMFPAKQLEIGLLKEILRGGHDKVVEAGAVIAGGHTVEDSEPKYGLSVNGLVHPERIIRNAGARPGDRLVLTKPLGTGVLFNAIRDGKATYQEVERDVLPSVATLNGPAMEVALGFDLHACTDVTGFGLTGHLLEMVLASGVIARLRLAALPAYPGVVDMYRQGVTTGTNRKVRQMTDSYLELQIDPAAIEQELLFDPQTSGGLLLAVPADQVSDLVAALNARGCTAATCIGEINSGPPAIIVEP